MSICKQIFMNCVNDFITSNTKYISVVIFNFIYLILMVTTLSLGSYSLVYNKDFATWGWIVFTIGCLLLMMLVGCSIMYWICEFVEIIEKDSKNIEKDSKIIEKDSKHTVNPISTNPIMNKKMFKHKKLFKHKKILSSERVIVDVKN